ncbi:MAG: hypothetical protein WBE57_21705, partial [Xanthobacteraceae bacterium]
ALSALAARALGIGALTLTLRKPHALQELVKFVCNNGSTNVPLFAGVFMSDNLAVPMKSAAPRSLAADTRILAQVEKWMALIREIKQERVKN